MNINAYIKRQYLDMILKGVKTTEYREMTEYWTDKLVDIDRYKGKTPHDVTEMLKLGEIPLHPKPVRQITFYCDKKKSAIYKVLGIKVYQGHKLYAIRLGERIS